MTQNPFSRQTEDKVKLAKKYIQGTAPIKKDKYQAMLTQETQQQQNWKQILSLINKNKLHSPQKQKIQEQFLSQQQLKTRMIRQKDSLENYQLYDLIGRGAFGDVKLARNKLTGKMVAIKRMEKKR